MNLRYNNNKVKIIILKQLTWMLIQISCSRVKQGANTDNEHLKNIYMQMIYLFEK